MHARTHAHMHTRTPHAKEACAHLLELAKRARARARERERESKRDRHTHTHTHTPTHTHRHSHREHRKINTPSHKGSFCRSNTEGARRDKLQDHRFHLTMSTQGHATPGDDRPPNTQACIHTAHATLSILLFQSSYPAEVRK